MGQGGELIPLHRAVGKLPKLPPAPLRRPGQGTCASTASGKELVLEAMQ